MKLFRETDRQLIPETVAYLLDKKNRSSTVMRIRALIAYLFHYRNYPAPDLFSLMRNADDEHAELVIDIIEGCSPKYGSSCFQMIDDLAPQIIDKFEKLLERERR